MRRVLLLLVLATGVSVGLGARAGIAASGPDLVGEWHLDQIGAGASTPDRSGNGLNGTGVSAATTPGRFGNAFQFANTGDGVDVADTAALRPNTMTVMAWVRQNGNPLQFRTLVGKGADGCGSRSYAPTSAARPGTCASR